MDYIKFDSLQLRPIHSISQEKLFGLNQESPWKGNLPTIIKQSVEESRLEPMSQKFIHWVVIHPTSQNVIGLVNLSPTGQKQMPGSVVEIYILSQYQPQNLMPQIITLLEKNPLLWGRLLWIITNQTDLIELLTQRWTQGPDIIKRSTFFFWVFHRCPRCRTNTCYLDRLCLLPTIRTANQNLATIDQQIKNNHPMNRRYIFYLISESINFSHQP